MRPWRKLLARAGQLLSLLLAHQMLTAQLPGPGLTTPEPNKSLRDCHIKPDLVLIYSKPDNQTLRLVRLGSHVELEL